MRANLLVRDWHVSNTAIYYLGLQLGHICYVYHKHKFKTSDQKYLLCTFLSQIY